MQTSAEKKKELVNDLLLRGGGMLLAKDAVAAGLSRDTLSQMAKKGLLIHDSRGVYLDPDEWSDDLYAMQQQTRKIIYSHEVALFLHGLSNRTPARYAFTVPSGYRVSQSLRKQCKVYYIKSELWNYGATTLPTGFGHNVTAYDMERTVCDLLRSRNRMEVDILRFALNSYVERGDKDVHRLMEYARIFHVYKLARQYMEILL